MEKREKNKNIIVLGIVMAISLSVALNIGNIFESNNSRLYACGYI